MKVSEVMTRDVRVANPNETVQQAARMMASLDAGVLPVGENDRLVGMISDRDIAIRGIAEGKGPEAKVRDVMTADVKYCFDEQDIEEVTRNMGDIQVRRLPVLDRNKPHNARGMGYAGGTALGHVTRIRALRFPGQHA